MSQRRQRPLQPLVLAGARRQRPEEQLACKDVQQWTTLIIWIPLFGCCCTFCHVATDSRKCVLMFACRCSAAVPTSWLPGHCQLH